MAKEAPQDQAARLYMEHKGYPGIEPESVERLSDLPCWYYYYEMPEGLLELEVFWDASKQDWVTTVTTFSRSDRMAGCADR